MTIHTDLARTDRPATAPYDDVPAPAAMPSAPMPAVSPAVWSPPVSSPPVSSPPVSPPPVSPPPVDPVAIGALVAALPAPPVGVALGIVALRRMRTGERRGTGLAVAGLVVGGTLTVFWALVATLMVVGIVAAAAAPPAAPTSSPAAASSPSSSPAPTAPQNDATDPGVVSAAQLEQKLAGGIGLPTGAVSCPSELAAHAGASETCSAELPGRGAVPVVVTVTSVHGEDVNLGYQAAPSAT